MVPGKSQDPVQYIDGRDVASFMIRLIENRTAGIFNAVGPASPTVLLFMEHMRLLALQFHLYRSTIMNF